MVSVLCIPCTTSRYRWCLYCVLHAYIKVYGCLLSTDLTLTSDETKLRSVFECSNVLAVVIDSPVLADNYDVDNVYS